MHLLSISYSLKLIDTDQQTGIATYRAAISAETKMLNKLYVKNMTATQEMHQICCVALVIFEQHFLQGLKAYTIVALYQKQTYCM